MACHWYTESVYVHGSYTTPPYAKFCTHTVPVYSALGDSGSHVLRGDDEQPALLAATRAASRGRA